MSEHIIIRNVKLLYPNLTKPSSLSAEFSNLAYGAGIPYEKIGFRPAYKKVKICRSTGVEFVHFGSRYKPIFLATDEKRFAHIRQCAEAMNVPFDQLFRSINVDVYLGSFEAHDSEHGLYKAHSIQRIYVKSSELAAAFSAYTSSMIAAFKE